MTPFAGAPAVSVTDVKDALRAVLDPELGMSVVELGLVYGVEVTGGAVGITMTLTAPGCPIHDVMAEWVRAAVLKVPGVERVEVALTFDPPWTPDRIERRLAGGPASGRSPPPTKALDLSARRQRPVTVPITPEDESA